MEDFDRLYEDELELMREMEDVEEPSSRRALQLSSPLVGSRKRPSENSPLPLLNFDSGDTPAKVSPNKIPCHTCVSGSPSTPISVRPKGSQSTPVNPSGISVNSCEGPGRGQHVRSKGGHLSARRQLHDKARLVLHDEVAPKSPVPSPPLNGYLRSPSPYSLGSTPSPPSQPDISALEWEEEQKRDKRSSIRVQTTPPSQPHKKVSDWLGGKEGVASDQKRQGQNTLEEAEPEGSMSPLECELRDLEEHYHKMEVEMAGSPVGGSGDPTSQQEEPCINPSLPKPKRLRVMESGNASEETAVGMCERVGGKKVLTREPGCPHISITGTDGTRVYLRMTSPAEEGEKGKLSSLHHHLLPVQFTHLRQMVEQERRRRLIEQSDYLLQSLQGDVGESQPLFESEETVKTGNKEGEEGEEGSNIGTLWVEKYSPKNYTELLSDDGINRTLLTWLKLWDEAVFGRKSVIHEKTEKEKKMEEKKGKRGDKKVDMQDPGALTNPEALDESRRPKVKIALLCGAPGLGKTTLAHVIAQHAGYNVVEINASDDRSPEVFRNSIESCTQMQAVLTSDSRPNCLIIDEIDGAPTAAINVLIDLIKKKEGSGKKKKKDIILLRPIICICNDQYAPSLRQLRQHALLLYFPPTASARLAARLQQVAKRERMSAAISTLMALCEKSENDIRSCLNTLQFIHKKQKELTLAAVQSISLGQKDAQRSLFSLWKEVFQLSVSKRHTLNTGPLKLSGFDERLAPTAGNTCDAESGEDRTLSANASRFYQILSSAMATGEYEKVVQGLFENYLLMRFRDPNMKAITLGQDWFVFHDVLQRHISQSQDYLCTRYQPFAPVAFHFLFSSLAKPQIKYPHSDFEAFQHQQQNQHLISSLVTELPPGIKQYITPAILSVDVLSPLLEIISPVFRPVSIQLYSAREKQQLADLVNTMISCGVTYRQEKGPDGQYTYILDPNIEQLCRFPGLPQKRQLTYSAKQMISREIELEKLRRAENIQAANEINTTASNVPTVGTSNAGNTGTRSSTALPHSSSSCLLTEVSTDETAEKVEKFQIKLKDEKPPMDFFGRMAKPKCTSGSSGATAGSSTHPLWFKFNEGFSNAVRRPVRVQDLL